MKLGPFPKRELDRITTLLNERGISHSVIVDEALARQKLDAVKQKSPDPLPTSEFDPACTFVEVDDSKANDVGNVLESFGVVVNPSQPNFDSAEFICRRCGYTSEHPGKCPHHEEMLVDFSTYAAHQTRSKELKSWKIVAYILGPVILAVLYAYFFR